METLLILFCLFVVFVLVIAGIDIIQFSLFLSREEKRLFRKEKEFKNE